jgi:hypothetical protein
VPTYLLSDNEKTVAVEHVAREAAYFAFDACPQDGLTTGGNVNVQRMCPEPHEASLHLMASSASSLAAPCAMGPSAVPADSGAPAIALG